MMRGLIELANTAEDERVRSVCLVAVLDRAGIRGMDYDPKEDEARERSKFNPRDYTSEELKVIEAALRLMTRSKL